jgi:hypothetical protein
MNGAQGVQVRLQRHRTYMHDMCRSQTAQGRQHGQQRPQKNGTDFLPRPSSAGCEDGDLCTWYRAVTSLLLYKNSG